MAGVEYINKGFSKLLLFLIFVSLMKWNPGFKVIGKWWTVDTVGTYLNICVYKNKYIMFWECDQLLLLSDKMRNMII